ncbi:MAG TPA: NAD(P)H-binding protein [Bacteroidales bacterium]|nr:NAD(P)H-binding protein [Bacteroidales bacterium]
MGKTALVIGATGLVGKALVSQLLDDDTYVKVKVFVRRPTGITSQKLEEHIIDFDLIETWKNLVRGDVLFSALGTTLARAGSRKAQYLVDFMYQFRFAQAAAENHLPVFVLVSSVGADPKSKIFYLRMKGQLEEAVKTLKFSGCVVLRPGPLTGKRKEFRFGERLGILLVRLFNKVGFFTDYKPISDEQVANVMRISAAYALHGFEVLGPGTLFQIADTYKKK